MTDEIRTTRYRAVLPHGALKGLDPAEAYRIATAHGARIDTSEVVLRRDGTEELGPWTPADVDLLRAVYETDPLRQVLQPAQLEQRVDELDQVANSAVLVAAWQRSHQLTDLSTFDVKRLLNTVVADMRDDRPVPASDGCAVSREPGPADLLAAAERRVLDAAQGLVTGWATEQDKADPEMADLRVETELVNAVLALRQLVDEPGVTQQLPESIGQQIAARAERIGGQA